MERRLTAVMAADMVGYSRLMEADEDDVFSRQKAHRKELIDPEIDRCRGRIVKTTGDGMLAQFVSSLDAVRCAIDIQTAMTRREALQGEDRRIRYRVGINLGDVIFDEDDIFGDGVNVATRLEGLAKPGGVCISDIVHETILDRVGEPFRYMGSQRVKSISRPIKVWQWTPDAPRPKRTSEVAHKQWVQFCRSVDGTQIAFASVGEGPPILKAPHRLNHIEYEWGSPVWGDFLEELARDNRLVRFDQRGNGLSDWDVDRISEEAMLEDMEAVADAAGLSRFALVGMSQGASFAMRYAVKHPHRVSCMVLYGGFVRGRLIRDDPGSRSYYETAKVMIREGWGSPNPVYRNFFTSGFLPEASREVQSSFDELQRICTSPENAMRIWEMNSGVDATEIARQVDVPTLIIHLTNDRMIPVSEGRFMARLIPGASFVELPGTDHILSAGVAGFDRFFDEARTFLAEHARN